MTIHEERKLRPQGALAVGLQPTLMGYSVLLLSWDKVPVKFLLENGPFVSDGSWQIVSVLHDLTTKTCEEMPAALKEAERIGRNEAKNRGIRFHEGM